jgi:uncharacterized glyoxalase superfamily metalloenzyme YdcJ
MGEKGLSISGCSGERTMEVKDECFTANITTRIKDEYLLYSYWKQQELKVNGFLVNINTPTGSKD